MKVLVVDDVGYTRHFHVRLLQKFGHEVLSAESGPQALTLLERDASIDVVLTDLMMREMDGVELFKAARVARTADSGHLLAPVFILVTALQPGGNSHHKDIEKLRMAKEIGFLDVLYKPIDAEQLRTVLDNARFARGNVEIDVTNPVRMVTSTVEQLIHAKDAEASTKFIECLRTELNRLEAATANETVTEC